MFYFRNKCLLYYTPLKIDFYLCHVLSQCPKSTVET